MPLVLILFLLIYSGPALTAPKSFFKSISAQFDLIDFKTNAQIIRLSFDGRFGDKLLASIEKPAVISFPACEYSAEFKEVIVGKEKGLQLYLTTTCNENNQKNTTKHGRVLIKESKILSFKKTIYLSKTYPQIIIKTKDISY